MNENKDKALSVRQPWAQLIISGMKGVENRSWKTPYRGRLYIHAGKSFDWSALEWLKENNMQDEYDLVIEYFGVEVQQKKPVITKNKNKLGAMIGYAQLFDCVENHESKWSMPGVKYQWLFKTYGVGALIPTPMPGQLGLFDPTGFRTMSVRGSKLTWTF